MLKTIDHVRLLKEGCIYLAFGNWLCFLSVLKPQKPFTTFLLIKKIDIHGAIDLLVLEKEGIRTIPAWGSFDWRFQEVE